jgi:hypothetical protein
MLRNVTDLHGHRKNKQNSKPLLSKGYKQINTFVRGEVQKYSDRLPEYGDRPSPRNKS